MHFLGTGLVLLLLVAGAVRPGQQKTASDLDRLGPQVGQRVPDFTLPDQNGKSHTLKSILGPNGAILVFYRSADW